MDVKIPKRKQILISEKDVKMAGDIDFITFMQMITSTLLQVMRNTRDGITNRAKPEDREETYKQIEGDIYDSVNLAMSNVLHMFAPELDMRPDLTEEATKLVLAVEDDIVKRAAEGDVEAMRIVTGNPNWVGEEECEESSTDVQDVEQN